MQQNIEPFTAPLVASELLPPVLSKLSAPLEHGHSAFEFSIQEDASGQARQRVQGQHPPMTATAPAAAPGLLPLPAAATPRLLPPPAAAPGLLPAPAPFAVAAPIAPPHDKKVPRTTAWRRRKAEEAAAAARAQGLTPKIRRTPEHLVCHKCGQPKTKEFGHSQFWGVHFCAQASGKTVAQWLEEVKKGQT